MKKYTMLQAFPLSFYSKKLYQDIAKNWQGLGYIYILILLALCWIPIMYQMQMGVNHFVDKYAPQFIEQMPKIHIINGEVSINKPEPYFIYYPNSQKVFAIIDTTGKYTNVKQTQAQMLLTKKRLYLRNRGDKIREYNLRDIDNLTITKQYVYQRLHTLKTWLIIFLYPVLVFLSFIYRIIQLFIYAAIGLFIFAKTLEVKIDYQAVMRLAAVAITPAVILSTVLDFSGVNFKYQWFIYFIIAMIYLYYAVRANYTPKEEM